MFPVDVGGQRKTLLHRETLHEKPYLTTRMVFAGLCF